MRILLDEQLPRKLVAELVGHEVSTVQEEGWAGFKNGDLLRAAASRGIQVFITKDQSIEYQQNLGNAELAIVVVAAQSHDIRLLRPLVPAVLNALDGIQPASFVAFGSNRVI